MFFSRNFSSAFNDPAMLEYVNKLIKKNPDNFQAKKLTSRACKLAKY